MLKLSLSVILPLYSFPAMCGTLPNVPPSFTSAKEQMYTIHSSHKTTFYCGCSYSNPRSLNLSTCGLSSFSNRMRAVRTEAEHVFPASQFGNFRVCWRSPSLFSECLTSSGKTLGGRECCLKVDPVFKAAHNDLYNLYPTNGYINGVRSNYNWGVVSSPKVSVGSCEIKIDPSIRRAEPPDKVKGDVSRTMFYMSETYGFSLSSQDIQLFNAWSKQDPPDPWEIERSRRIKAIQGVGNRFIDSYKQ